METQEEKKVTKPIAKKTKFGDVKQLGREIDKDLLYFYVRDYTINDDEKRYEKVLRISSSLKFLKHFSPFERGRPLSFLKNDEIFVEFTKDIKGLLKLKTLLDEKNDKQICSDLGLSLRSDKPFIEKLRKELKYLSINGSKAKRVLISDLIQVIDIDGKELFKEDLK